jgi:hypothetical protein
MGTDGYIPDGQKHAKPLTTPPPPRPDVPDREPLPDQILDIDDVLWESDLPLKLLLVEVVSDLHQGNSQVLQNARLGGNSDECGDCPFLALTVGKRIFYNAGMSLAKICSN